MKYSYLLLILLCFCSLCQKATAQLVNIESKRMHTDSTRFVLKSDLLFNYTDNNGDYLLQINSNLSTQYKSKSLRSIFFIIADYNLIRAKAQDFQNVLFLHSRFNQKIVPALWYEAFAQFQNNTQLIIARRSLFGTGLRYEFIQKDRTQLYLGNAYVYGIERIQSIETTLYNHRNSTYLSINQTLKRFDLSFTGTLYFQPLYRRLSNHRILAQIKAELPISKTISVSGLYNYTYMTFARELPEDYASVVNFGITLNL